MTLLEDVNTCRDELEAARDDGAACKLALAKTDELLSRHELPSDDDLEWILERVKKTAAVVHHDPEFFKFEANWTHHMLGGWTWHFERGDSSG